MPSKSRLARAPRPLRPALVALAAVLVTGVVCFAGSLSGRWSVYSATAEALVALAGTGLLGADGDPETTTTARSASKWIGAGVLSGGLGAIALIGIARATHAFTSVTVDAASLGAGTIAAAIVLALRDELLLRGLVLRVAGQRSALGLAACGLASAAWAVGASGGSGISLTGALVEAFLGVCLGAMWLRERGAFMAVSAHATWLLATTRGPVILRAAPGFWGGGAGALDGVCVAVVLGLACVGSAAWTFGARRETSTPPRPLG